MDARPLIGSPYDPPAKEELRTIYNGEGFVVVDKPSGLLSVPGRGPEKAICAASIASERLAANFTVHRLDMDTSGLMLFAKTKAVQSALSKAFENRQVKKVYEALVDGEVPQDEGEIDLPIAKHSLQRPLRHICEEGRPSVTRWKVIDRTRAQTRLHLFPLTGRSHQLRLHLRAIGHPISGDVFYGDPDSFNRLALHALSLEFTDPVSKNSNKFNSGCPF